MYGGGEEGHFWVKFWALVQTFRARLELARSLFKGLNLDYFPDALEVMLVLSDRLLADLTDVTLVSDDTFHKLDWCCSSKREYLLNNMKKMKEMKKMKKMKNKKLWYPPFKPLYI